MSFPSVTTFQLRSKNSAGTVQHTFKPLVGSPATPGTYLVSTTPTKSRDGEVREPREDVNWVRKDIIRGRYPILNVHLECIGDSWPGAVLSPGPPPTYYDSLDTITTDFDLGLSLEVSLNSGSTWLAVTLESDDQEQLDPPNQYAFSRDMTFKGVAFTTAEGWF